jgi:hypothetical protein
MSIVDTVQNNPDLYLKWLEYFMDNADFGPAHEDVVDILWQGFLEEEGLDE